jgi:predicted Na+-dependent transporter
MAINISQQTFGYILIVLGIIVAITGFISFRKGGRMKLIIYIGFVVISIGLGLKLAFSPEKKPMEIKQVTLPSKPVRH